MLIYIECRNPPTRALHHASVSTSHPEPAYALADAYDEIAQLMPDWQCEMRDGDLYVLGTATREVCDKIVQIIRNALGAAHEAQ